MTDNENIKALENLHNRILKDASFLAKVNHGELSALFHIRRILELQDAEIEKLNVELVGMRGACESYKMHYDKAQTEIERLTVNKNACALGMEQLAEQLEQAKSEAIKEFAERFKKKYEKPFFYLGSYEQFMREVDDLVKEMTEGNENG